MSLRLPEFREIVNGRVGSRQNSFLLFPSKNFDKVKSILLNFFYMAIFNSYHILMAMRFSVLI